MKAIGKKKVRDLVMGDIFSVKEKEFDETAQLRYIYDGSGRTEDVRYIKQLSNLHGPIMSSLDWHTFNFTSGGINYTDVKINHFGTQFTHHHVASLDTEVYYFGRRTEDKFMTKQEKEQLAKEIWNKTFSILPSSVRLPLENCYYARLFGKRGQYDEIGDRFYLKQSLKAMRDLSAMVGNKTIQNVMTKREDCVDDLAYSREYETECYGSRHALIKIEFTDGSRDTYYF